MKRFSLLLVMLVATLSFLPGCGDGASKPSAADQQKKVEQSKADMAKGMEAMKALKGPKK
jgi:hypothetical protein